MNINSKKQIFNLLDNFDLKKLQNLHIYTQEALQVKINITENYFPVQCQMCGWFGSSSELHGGSAIADTGDLDNCYCPVCGQCDTDECEEIISIFSYKDAYEKTKNILIQTKKALEEIHWKYISEKLN